MRRALIACTAMSLLGVVSALVDYGLGHGLLWSSQRSSLSQEAAVLFSALAPHAPGQRMSEPHDGHAGSAVASRQQPLSAAHAAALSTDEPEYTASSEESAHPHMLAAAMTPLDMPFPDEQPVALQDVNRPLKADRLIPAQISVAKLDLPQPEPLEEGASAALFLLSPMLEEASPAPAAPPAMMASFTPPATLGAQPARDPFVSSAAAAANVQTPAKYGWSDLVRMAAMKGGDGEEPSRIFGALSEKEFRARELRCMATAIYFEARGETVRGQVAVGQVIMTRVRSNFYPNTICGVVFQGQWNRNACQFSFACDGQTDAPKEAHEWKVALDVARDVISGKAFLPEIAEATHYHAVYVHPDWIKEVKRIKQIGVHIFYKAPFVQPLATDPAYNAG